MHKRVQAQLARQKEERKEQLEKKKQEKEKKEAEERKKREKEAKDKKSEEIKEVKGLSWIISLVGGLKVDIKRIHFRYEDDYFQHHKPFSFGLMVESIQIDNSDSDWVFDSPLAMNFYRQKPL